MKIQRIVPILLFICLCLVARSQDVIITKDSRQIQAEIIEVSPTVIKYKIYQRPNSPIVSIPIREVQKVIYEKSTAPGDTNNNFQRILRKKEKIRPFLSGTALHAYIESSFSHDAHHNLNYIEPLRITLGAQIKDYIYLGAGMGAAYFPDINIESGYEMLDTFTSEYYDKIPQYKLSTFGVFKLTLPITENIVPYIDAEGGITVCRREWTEKWFLAPFFSASVGISIYHITISGGYEQFTMPVDRMYKPYKEWTYYNESSHANGSANFGNFFIRIGAKIGNLKN